MSFIEGIGDEVVLFFVIVLVFALAALITLVGSVPPVGTTTTVIRINDYEQNSFEQTENSAASSSIPTPSVRLRHGELHVVGSLHTNTFIIEETGNEILENSSGDSVTEPQHTNESSANADLRTEADGSSVGADGLRTEADGRAEQPVDNADTNRVGDGLQNPSPENSGEEEGGTPVAGEMHVRLKYLNDTVRLVATHPSTKIGDFKKKHFRDVISENKIVRLIFAGRLLQDQMTIENCRILDNSVVHVQVLPAPTPQSNQPATPDTDLDMGRLLVPAITLLLGICWVLYSKYPEFFSTLSLGVLGTLSCCFLAYVVQTRR